MGVVSKIDIMCKHVCFKKKKTPKKRDAQNDLFHERTLKEEKMRTFRITVMYETMPITKVTEVNTFKSRTQCFEDPSDVCKSAIHVWEVEGAHAVIRIEADEFIKKTGLDTTHGDVG